MSTSGTAGRTAPAEWAVWNGDRNSPYTVGIEEEFMLLDPSDWSLAQQVDTALPALSSKLARRATAETHRAALELRTGVHRSVPRAAAEMRELRAALDDELRAMGLRAASAGTHPLTVWQETEISSAERYQALYGSMRELARREPTFSLHVHVGVPRADDAIRLTNRLRGHVPLLLALSANSPFWQGRDSGLASARTPLFQAFPRVGVPREFRDYQDYVESVDLLLRCEAFPDPTYLWWDVRPQASLGTVEVRIMDAQTTVDDTAALAALVQALARLEVEERFVSPRLVQLPEVLNENRFLAARDGADACFIDPERVARVPLGEELEALLEACAPHAADLGCTAELADVRTLAGNPGHKRQLAAAAEVGAEPEAEPRLERRLQRLVASLAEAFCASRRPAEAGPET